MTTNGPAEMRKRPVAGGAILAKFAGPAVPTTPGICHGGIDLVEFPAAIGR